MARRPTEEFPETVAVVQHSVVMKLDAAEKARLAAELSGKTTSGQDFQKWLAHATLRAKRPLIRLAPSSRAQWREFADQSASGRRAKFSRVPE